MQFLVEEFIKDPTAAMEAASNPKVETVEILGEDGEPLYVLMSAVLPTTEVPGELGETEVGASFQEMNDRVTPELREKLDGASYLFHVGEESFLADLSRTEGPFIFRASENDKARCTITVDNPEHWSALVVKKSMNPTSAFMMGRLKVKGDMSLAMKLQALI